MMTIDPYEDAANSARREHYAEMDREEVIRPWREMVEDLVVQFAHPTPVDDGRWALTTGGLYALETAFSLLGWSDPHIPGAVDD